MVKKFILNKRLSELLIYSASPLDGFCQFRDLPGYEKWIVKRTDTKRYAIYVRGWAHPVRFEKTIADVTVFMRDYTVKRWTCTDMFTGIEITEDIQVMRKVSTGRLAA